MLSDTVSRSSRCVFVIPICRRNNLSFVKGKNMHFNLRSFALFLLLAGIAAGSACAQPAIQPNVDITQVPAAAQPSPQFNADAATEAYMAMIPPAATARSNAYFEGG
jgi:hypothetical protein